MSVCQHDFGIGVMQVGDECIVYVKCRNCELMATGAGAVTDLGGGYSVIEPA
jgi:hypothetical protein